MSLFFKKNKHNKIQCLRISDRAGLKNKLKLRHICNKMTTLVIPFCQKKLKHKTLIFIKQKKTNYIKKLVKNMQINYLKKFGNSQCLKFEKKAKHTFFQP